MAATTTTAEPTNIATLEAKIETLTLTVHRLAQVVNSRLQPPAERLTVDEVAARTKKSKRSLEDLFARRVFTDHRGGKKGTRLIYADEVEALMVEGEQGVLRLRSELGRD